MTSAITSRGKQPGAEIPSNSNDRPKRKRDSEGKRQALIQAATELFASQGYESTTTRQIAARAGCAEGLIHRYFQSKSGLLFALMRWHEAKNEAQLSGGLPFACDLETEICQIVEWELQRHWQDRHFLRVALSRAILDEEAGRFLSKVGPYRRVQSIMARLQRFEDRENGRRLTARRKKDIEACAHAIGALGFAFGFMAQVVFRFDRKHVHRFAATVAKSLARGLQES
jgi:AcrR family transcriptional regulator